MTLPLSTVQSMIEIGLNGKMHFGFRHTGTHIVAFERLGAFYTYESRSTEGITRVYAIFPLNFDQIN